MDRISKELRFKENPRTISDRQLELLRAHLDEFGDLSGVVYCRKNKAYAGGNQRSLHFDGYPVEITQRFKKPTATGTVALGYIEKDGERYAYREVSWSEEQFRKACIVANNDGGDWDWSILEGWDQAALSEWGMIMMGGKEEDGLYTRLVKSPLYEMKGEKPNLGELLDDGKAVELIKEIESEEGLGRGVKKFLVNAARRHVVFDYEKIAEFYAHSPKNVQRLMEKSALVIIDFNKAIEYGFVKLTEEINQAYKDDYAG